MATWRAEVVVAVQLLSRLRLIATPWTAAHQASPSFAISWSLLKFMFIASVMPSNHLILSPPSLPALNICQHQGLFQWVSSLHQGAKGLELQNHSFQCIFWGWFPFGLPGLISLQSKGLSRVFSNSTVQKHQFFSTQPSLWSNSHIHTWLLEKSLGEK